MGREGGAVEYHYRASGGSSGQTGPERRVELYEPGKPAHPLGVETGNPYDREIAYFVACVREGSPPETIRPEDARLAVEVALAARASLETGAPVDLG